MLIYIIKYLWLGVIDFAASVCLTRTFNESWPKAVDFVSHRDGLPRYGSLWLTFAVHVLAWPYGLWSMLKRILAWLHNDKIAGPDKLQKGEGV